jgi:AbiV family abortive infection protein
VTLRSVLGAYGGWAVGANAKASRADARYIKVLDATGPANLVRMPKMTSVPDLDSLGALALAAARNSRRLLDDAELLLNHGRRPSAYSLAVLAFEEAGKAWLCIVAMMVPADVRPDWPHDDLIARHVDKLMAAHMMVSMLSYAYRGQDVILNLISMSEHLEELAREHNQAKQRGLYVDLLDGTVREPASVTKDEAQRMVAIVRSLLDNGGYLADPEFIAWLADETQEAVQMKELAWGRFFTGLQQGSPEGMAASIQLLMDETGATEGLPMMVREQTQRAALAGATGTKRVQPRKLSRSQRRAR